ncbi:hypothetical protein GCM10027080_11970 [Pedococcus soli]
MSGLDEGHPTDLDEVVGVDAASAVATSDSFGQVQREEHGLLTQSFDGVGVPTALGPGEQPVGQVVSGREVVGPGLGRVG